MALNRWIAKQLSTKQIGTGTVTAYDVATTYKATIGSKVISTIGVGGSTNTTAAALYALMTASTEPEFQEVTWTNATNVITGTSKVAGRPFVVTFSVTAGTGTISGATTTANTSPNDVADVLNWSAGSLPVNGDDVLLDLGGTAQGMKWGLNALSGVTLNSFTRRKSFTGKIGLPELNVDGNSYTEYRGTELQFGLQGAFLALFEQTSSDSAAGHKLNTGATQTTLTVLGDGASRPIGSESLWWRGTSASNAVNCENGSLAVSVVFGATNPSTIATLSVDGSSVRCGAGVTLTTLNNLSGTVELNNSVTTITQQAGKTTVKGSATVGTCTIYGGSVVYMSTGTITTLTVGSAGTIDFSQDNRTRTVTNKASMYRGSTLIDTAATTIGMQFQTIGCKVSDCRIDYGMNHSYTTAA